MKFVRTISVAILLTLAVTQVVCGQTWTKLSTTGGPTTDNGSSLVYDQTSNRLIFFGGVISTPCCTSNNDVWVLTNPNGLGGSSVWNKLNPAIPDGAPPARSFQSAVYDSANNIMIIFGGGVAGTCGFFCTIYNDVWVLTNANGIGGTPTWIPLAPTGTPPVAREGHTAIYDSTDNRMIVFGGGNNGIMDVPNDLWALDNANGLNGTPQWVQLSEGGQVPPPVERFATAYDAANNRMTIFGGCCYWNNTTWLLTSANGLAGTPTWTQLSPSGTVPQIREVHAFGYDPALNELIIFGLGADGVSYNDTWALSSANDIIGTPSWANVIPNNQPGSPPFPFLAADPGVYDPVNSRLMLVKSQDNGQGELQIVPWVLSLNKGFLSFPLPGLSPETASMSAVMDHSEPQGTLGQPVFYTTDNTVKAYTGEQGLVNCGHPNCIEPNSAKLGIFGYKSASGQPFVVNGNGTYTGGGGCSIQPCKYWLFYDGHSGYDYPQPMTETTKTQVIAPADGLLFIPKSDPIANPSNPSGAVSRFFILGLSHGNGYTSWFMHMGCEGGTINKATGQVVCQKTQDFRGIDALGNIVCSNLQLRTTGCAVKAGQVIGLVGNKGLNLKSPTAGSAHLHFEVREGLTTTQGQLPSCVLPVCVTVDPYGWSGSYPDPYAKYLLSSTVPENLRLWK